MRRTNPSLFSALNAMTGVAGILFGVIAGYIMGASQIPSAPAAFSASLPQDHPAPVVNESELKALQDLLAGDPKNPKTAIELGNRLYDAGRYADAIPVYRQALAADPKNANVSTDLATALFYIGSVDEALRQLDVSLAIDPSHAQTLFNIGIVRRDGKKDPKGAAAAWEQLLATHPNYPEAARVRAMLDELRAQAPGSRGN